MIYMNVKCEDLISQNILTKQEVDWANSARIPYNATGDQWLEKHRIDRLVKKAVESGAVSEIPREEVKIERGPQIIGDYINGAGGALKNMADGKMYDSKSAYYKAVKAAGCVVVGNDAPTTAKPIDPKVCDKELKRDIAQAINQLGG